MTDHIRSNSIQPAVRNPKIVVLVPTRERCDVLHYCLL
jgi:hypothetical protein